MERLEHISLAGVTLVTEKCCKCNTPFAMSLSIYNAASQRKEAMGFYCPNGHEQHYVSGETAEDKLRRERDRLRQENARLADQAREAQEQAGKAEKSLARHKKRAAAGTCPCCSRTFRQLAAHMKNKHPQWAKEAGAKVVPLKAS